MKLEMLPPTSGIIPANSQGTVSQEIRITNSLQGEKPVMLKLKITYKLNGQPVRMCVVE
jgi:AP-1 complex subunit gamma-1